MNSRKIAVIGVLIALAIATNYAMLPLYNVKFMDVIVFIGGFIFGPFVGASIGILSWTVYGTLNPNGFSMLIWLATMFSEMVFGVAGGLVGKTTRDIDHQRAGLCLSFAALGGLLTFVYDVTTNVAWGYSYGPSVIGAVVIGFVPFGLIHVVSNIVFFGVGCVPAISAAFNVIGGERIGVLKK
jgi:energy-coupling factor transport system substrate-specific component